MSEFEKIDAIFTLYVFATTIISFTSWALLYVAADQTKSNWRKVLYYGAMIPSMIIIFITFILPVILIREHIEDSQAFKAEVMQHSQILEEYLLGQKVQENMMWWRKDRSCSFLNEFEELGYYKDIFAQHIGPEPEFGHWNGNQFEWLDFHGYCEKQVKPILYQNFTVQRDVK